MSDPITNCENLLASQYGRGHCILTGRGATALWVAYQLAIQKNGRQNRKIMLPALVCLSPVFTVYYAGASPLFADVREADGTIDPDQVATLLEKDNGISAVVAVHLFGHPADMNKLAAVCRKKNIVLIEDAAQAQGGRDADGHLIGSIGDVSVLSFGHTKILDVEGGGGAVLTDDNQFAEDARKMLATLKPKRPDNDILANIYSRLYYMIQEAGQHDSRFFHMFDSFPECFKPLYLYSADEKQAHRIMDALGGLEEEIRQRSRAAEVYKKRLCRRSEIHFFRPQGRPVPWRFTFRVPADKRDFLLRAVRENGYDISAWYPAVPTWTVEGRMQKKGFPIAEVLEKEVVNLWVNHEYSQKKAALLAAEITSFFESRLR